MSQNNSDAGLCNPETKESGIRRMAKEMKTDLRELSSLLDQHTPGKHRAEETKLQGSLDDQKHLRDKELS